jgi:ATP-dependent helicase HrpA
VSLFGLTIVQRRRVRYTAIDPRTSRRLFIQHGLVEGDFETKGDFLRHNKRTIESVEAKAAKARRREWIVDPQVVYDFYEARLPADIVDGPSLEKWRRDAERQNRRVLYLEERDLVGGQPVEMSPSEYPDVLQLDRMKLPLVYHFEPGAPEDGVTVTVPREGLRQLSEERLGWLVPGLVADKVQALIRTLPKDVRRAFGPAPEIAKKVAEKLPFATGPFLPKVAAELSAAAGERITPEMFDLGRLPPHLRMKIRVIDHGGKTVVEGRDLAALREHLGEEAGPPEPPPGTSPWHRDGLTKWDFGALPEQIETRTGGITLTRYPALIDAGQSVKLRHLDTRAEAERQTRLGALRLFVLAENRELRTQVRWLPNLEKMRLYAAPLTTSRPLEDQLIDLIGARAFYAVDAIPRDAESFEAQKLSGRKHILPAVQEVTKLVAAIFEAYHELRLALEQPKPATWAYALEDIRGQLAALVPEGFLATTPWPWLQQFPRFLKAMSLRLTKIKTSGIPRDRQAHDQVAPRWAAYQERQQDHQKRGTDDPELAHYRWMLEELRVSLFAQELGTSIPVSPQRLDKQWAKTMV